MQRQIINAACGCETSEGIWFVHYVFSLLMFFSYKENKITKSILIEDGRSDKIAPFLDMIIYENRVYLFPNNANYIWIYEVASDEVHKIEHRFADENNFRRAFRIGKTIYVIPYKTNNILRMDIETEKIELLSGLDSIYGFINNNSPYVYSCCLYRNKYCVCTIPHTNSLAIYDIDEMAWKKIETPNRDYVQVVEISDKLYAFNYSSYTIDEISIDGNVLKSSNKTVSVDVELHNLGNDSLVANDIRTGLIEVYSGELEKIGRVETSVINSDLTTDFHQACWIKGVNKACAITKGNELLVFNRANKYYSIQLHMDEELWNKNGIDLIKNNIKKIPESEMCSIEAFLSELSSAKST